MEIAVYRKLVESEEDRLGIDVTETGRGRGTGTGTGTVTGTLQSKLHL